MGLHQKKSKKLLRDGGENQNEQTAEAIPSTTSGPNDTIGDTRNSHGTPTREKMVPPIEQIMMPMA